VAGLLVAASRPEVRAQLNKFTGDDNGSFMTTGTGWLQIIVDLHTNTLKS
jgi:hypothetical protein